MSLFFGNNIALKGMMAQQTALNVAFNNVANANTDGYSRQRVDLQASNPISGIIYGEQLGSGVDVASVSRIRDEFLDYQLRTQTSELESQTTVYDILDRVETVFNDTATNIGISSDLNKFWNAWQDASVTPANPAVRTVLMESAVSLSDHINQVYSQLKDIQDDINTQIDLTVSAVNVIAERLNTLNTQIATSVMNGESPNDLRDSRDLLLDKLAEFGNITVSKRGTSGAIDVKIGDNTLVDENGPHSEIDPSTVKGGSLGALVKLGSTEGNNPGNVQYYMNKLDAVAASIAQSVNKLHAQGYDLEGKKGVAFFVSADGEEISAANITVNSQIQKNVYKIAASSSADNLTGNGEAALAIANLKTASQMSDAAGGLGKKTIDAFYQEAVIQLGSRVNEAESNVVNQRTLVNNLSLKKESFSGVSLDEETANIVVFQHAFSACARVISVVDEMLDTVINRMKA